MRWWVVLALVACGGTPAPDTISNRPIGPQAPSCTDAGAILRGPLVSDDTKAGPAREAAIVQACRDDSWTPEVLTCITASRTPMQCTDKLTQAQHASYQAKLDAWSAKYGGDGYGGDMYGGDMDGGPPPRFVDCSDAITVPERFAPELDPKAPEHDWVLAKRRAMIVQTCETAPWDEAIKECVESAPNGNEVNACMVDEPSYRRLVTRLTELDGIAAKIAAAKKKPASIDCAKVVAVRYGDPAWKDKLVDAKPADRKKLIAGSRVAMQKACVADKWTDTMRACIVSGGGDGCFDSNTTAVVWGYPAAIAGATALWPGIPTECQVYKVMIDKLMVCDKLPQASRDAMKQAFDQAAASWKTMPKVTRDALGPACRDVTDAVLLQLGSTCGW